MSRIYNKRGSALAWAACLLLVLTVLVGGMAGIASAFQRRGVRDIAQSQAYLAATGAVDAVLSLLDGALVEVPFVTDSQGNGLTSPAQSDIWQLVAMEYPLLPVGIGARAALTDFDFAEMSVDSAEGYIERFAQSDWRVCVTAVCGDVSHTASAVLRLEITAAGQARAQAAQTASAAEVFHANVIENLTLTGGAAFFAGGGPLYLGKITAAGEASVAPGGALFTREALHAPVLPGESRRIYPASGGVVSVFGGESFSGAMRGFGDVFLPANAVSAAASERILIVNGTGALDLGGLARGETYVFMGGTAELTLTGISGGAAVYIYCPEGGKIVAENGVKLRGAVNAHSLEARGEVQIEYTAPAEDFRVDTGESAAPVYPAGAYDYKWSFERYE